MYLWRFCFEEGYARFYPLEYNEPSEGIDDEYGLYFKNGRRLEHFYEGNMTYKCSGFASRTPLTFVEVSPELALERGIRDGALVRLTSHQGAVISAVTVSDKLRSSERYMHVNSVPNTEAIYTLTSSYAYVAAHLPPYKEHAAKMTQVRERYQGQAVAKTIYAAVKVLRSPGSGLTRN